MNDAAIADAARTYVAAWRRREAATSTAYLEALVAQDHAWLSLLIAVGPCPVCDDGATLEIDGYCSACGRRGSCPSCADDDCTHLTGPASRTPARD